MQPEEWIQKLKEEGYELVGIPRFPADSLMPEHTHDEATVHVVFEGEITLTDQEGSKTWRAGDRFDVPAGTTHHGKVGPQGCVFLAAVRATKPSA